MQSVIRNAPFLVFLAMVLVPLGMAGILVFAGWRARRQAALMATTPAVPISAAADGYVQIQGHVEAIDGEVLTAPLTGADCCWYEARLERWTAPRGGSKTPGWELVREVTSSAPLLVRDATGVCAVQVEGAEVTPTDRSRWSGARAQPEDRHPPRLGPTESLDGMVQIAGGDDRRYRYTEARIYPGDPLVVLGRLTTRAADAFDDAEDDGPEDRRGPSPGPDDWAAQALRRADDLWTRVVALTPRTIAAGGRHEPLVLSTTDPGTHAAMSELGSQAAFTIALGPLAIAALVLWARFG